MTLVELTVAMALMSIVLTLLALVFNNSLSVDRVVTTRVNSTAGARTAMESMTRHLRVAVTPNASTPAFVTGTATGVSFYASWVPDRAASPSPTPPVPTLFAYALDPTSHCLKEYSTPPSGSGTPPTYTWPASGTNGRCIAFGVVAVAFSYFPTGSSTAATANLASVSSVGISLTVASSAADTHPVNLVSRVSMSNLQSS